MLDWLTNDVDLFGLPAQNWMLLFGLSFLIYIAILALTWPRRDRSRAR
jgi:uncharacterized iron-regulated membrane protein